VLPADDRGCAGARCASTALVSVILGWNRHPTGPLRPGGVPALEGRGAACRGRVGSVNRLVSATRRGGRTRWPVRWPMARCRRPHATGALPIQARRWQVLSAQLAFGDDAQNAFQVHVFYLDASGLPWLTTWRRHRNWALLARAVKGPTRGRSDRLLIRSRGSASSTKLPWSGRRADQECTAPCEAPNGRCSGRDPRRPRRAGHKFADGHSEAVRR
jgi:hypothetical protein